MFRERDLPKESNPDKHTSTQEPRELTAVEPLCVAKALRRTKWQHVWMSGCGAPFWRISAAQGAIRGPAVDKEKPCSNSSSSVSHHRSGGQVQGLALSWRDRSWPSINYFQRDPLAEKPCTFLCQRKKQVEAEMEATLMSSCSAPFWRISAARGWKRSPAAGKR